MKRIILEGPDASGKTTLMYRLLKEFPQLEEFPSYSLLVPGMDFETYMGLAVSPDGPVYPRIHDRLFYSELVYGPIIRSKLALTPQRIRHYRTLLGESAFLIYCRIPYDLLVERITLNSQMEGVIPNLSKIYHDYEAIIGDNSSRYWIRNAYAMYDQSDESYSEVVRLVGDYLV